jgi:hypothetical protein
VGAPPPPPPMGAGLLCLVQPKNKKVRIQIRTSPIAANGCAGATSPASPIVQIAGIEPLLDRIVTPRGQRCNGFYPILLLCLLNFLLTSPSTRLRVARIHQWRRREEPDMRNSVRVLFAIVATFPLSHLEKGRP